MQQNPLTAKVKLLSDTQLIEAIKALAVSNEDGSDAVFAAVSLELEERLTEQDYLFLMSDVETLMDAKPHA